MTILYYSSNFSDTKARYIFLNNSKTQVSRFYISFDINPAKKYNHVRVKDFKTFYSKVYLFCCAIQFKILLRCVYCSSMHSNLGLYQTSMMDPLYENKSFPLIFSTSNLNMQCKTWNESLHRKCHNDMNLLCLSLTLGHVEKTCFVAIMK